LRTEGQADMTKLIFGFRNFAKNRLINVGITRFLLLVISSADVVCVMALLTLFFIALTRFTCLVTICSRKIGRSLHHVAGYSLKFNICTETAERVYPSCHHESGLTSRPVVFFPCRKKATRHGSPRRAYRSQQPSGLRINQTA